MAAGQWANVQSPITSECPPGLNIQLRSALLLQQELHKSYLKDQAPGSTRPHKALPSLSIHIWKPQDMTWFPIHLLITISPLGIKSRFNQRSRTNKRYIWRYLWQAVGFHDWGASKACQQSTGQAVKKGRRILQHGLKLCPQVEFFFSEKSQP